MAFLFVWGFVIVIVPASFALTALTFSDYALKPFFLDCDPPYYARLCLAAAAMSKCLPFLFFSLLLSLLSLLSLHLSTCSIHMLTCCLLYYC